MSNIHNTAPRLFLFLMCLWLVTATGCASLRTSIEPPTARVTSFTPIASQGLAPSFEIGLRVVNPNATSLSIRGMTYKIFLNGFEVVDGAANDLPTVPAYGEADIKVNATVGLMEGFRFVNDMLRAATGQVNYLFQARLDIGALFPTIPIEQIGSFSPP